jgi:hypothetical protein
LRGALISLWTILDISSGIAQPLPSVPFSLIYTVQRRKEEEGEKREG